MLKVISVAVLTALIGVILLGPVGEYVFRDIRAEKAFEHNEQGLSYLTDTRARQAIRSFKNAIALDPLEAAYHLNLAVVYENFPAVATHMGETGRQGIYRNIMHELLTVRKTGVAYEIRLSRISSCETSRRNRSQGVRRDRSFDVNVIF